ncbi:MAG: hypothetical protein GY913_18525 [Proteobacteria bacterium]|nr:hypothetical protein [Pseudomonadota bacterium]MCP4918906.1 hypothetical protein [Pseudomonadota bacterium]
MRRWLLAGALAAETLPLIQRVRRVRMLSHRLIEGELGGEQVAVLRVGVGPDKAERRTREAVQRWRPSHVVSFGTCGAISDDLPVGSVVGAASVRISESVSPADVLPGLRGVNLITVRRAVASASWRDELAAQGVHVCEMEASGVRAASRGLEFHAVKVVSDLAGGGGLDLSDPGPLAVMRFKALAALLVGEHLAPELERALSDYASSV